MSSLLTWPPPRRPDDSTSLLQDLFQTVVFVGVGLSSRLLLHGLNQVDVRPDNGEAFAFFLTNRSLRQAPLITIANHNSTIDDPVLLSTMAPIRVLLDPRRCCWSW
jgi:hypothetical protein